MGGKQGRHKWWFGRLSTEFLRKRCGRGRENQNLGFGSRKSEMSVGVQEEVSSRKETFQSGIWRSRQGWVYIWSHFGAAGISETSKRDGVGTKGRRLCTDMGYSHVFWHVPTHPQFKWLLCEPRLYLQLPSARISARLYHSRVVSPGASHRSSLTLGFLIYQMWRVIQGPRED